MGISQAGLTSDHVSEFQDKSKPIMDKVLAARGEIICWQDQLMKLADLSDQGKKISPTDVTCGGKAGCAEIKKCAQDYVSNFTRSLESVE